jgi:phosphoribosylformimino-5-aminoimidazole carboxamide ribotide isomerase
VEKATQKFGSSKIMAAIDLKKGVPAYHGWTETSFMDYVSLARKLEQAGVGGIILTCVDVDGTLSGASLKEVTELSKNVSVPVIASGGISDIKDIRNLAKLGIDGVIVGKALYEGKFSLREAMEH